MRKLWSDKRTRASLILNIAGALIVLVTAFLDEALNYHAFGLQSAGIILWLIGEGMLIRTLLEAE